MIYEQIDEQADAQQIHPKYGKSIVICNPECMLGPHCIFLPTIDFIFLPTFVFLSIFLIFLYSNVQQQLSPFWSGVILISIAIWMVSYLLVGFSNPGIVTKKNSEFNHDEHLNICV